MPLLVARGTVLSALLLVPLIQGKCRAASWSILSARRPGSPLTVPKEPCCPCGLPCSPTRSVSPCDCLLPGVGGTSRLSVAVPRRALEASSLK